MLANLRRRVAFERERGFDLLAKWRMRFDHEHNAIFLARLRLRNGRRIYPSIDTEDRFRRDEFLLRFENERINKGDRGPNYADPILLKVTLDGVNVRSRNSNHFVVLSILRKGKRFDLVVSRNIEDAGSAAKDYRK